MKHGEKRPGYDKDYYLAHQRLNPELRDKFFAISENNKHNGGGGISGGASKKKGRKVSRSESHRLWRYGLTSEAFVALLKKQNGQCAICKNDITGTKAASVDHDHQTKEVRGLLCHKCNRGLGLLGDTRENIQKVIEYLDKSIVAVVS